MRLPPELSSPAVVVEPVYVVPYDPRWSRLFEIERGCVEAGVGTWAETIERVCSTAAVPGLDAKPVVDVLVGLRDMRDAQRCVRPLGVLGYS